MLMTEKIRLLSYNGNLLAMGGSLKRVTWICSKIVAMLRVTYKIA